MALAYDDGQPADERDGGVVASARGLERQLAGFVARLEPEALDPRAAARLVEALSRMANLVELARAQCALRATAGKAHLDDGVRSPAAWLAGKAGGRVGGAMAELEGAEAAAAHPGLADAVSSGEVSLEQAAVLGEAAADGIEPDGELLDLARASDLKGLRARVEEERARRSREDDLAERHERLRRRRSFRTWTAADGALAGAFRLAPADAAGFVARLEVLRDGFFEEARRRGQHESFEAYAADALCALGDEEAVAVAGAGAGAEAVAGASGASGASRRRSTRTRVLLRVDVAALRRGEREGDEVCEIAGVGQVPLATARALLSDAVVDLVIRKGADVVSVTGLGRTIPTSVRKALMDRDPTCVVPGCGATQRLEIDHWQVDYHLSGPTRLDNLARLCQFHHRMKTHRGWRLAGGPGQWRWLAPGEGDEDHTDRSVELPP